MEEVLLFLVPFRSQIFDSYIFDILLDLVISAYCLSNSIGFMQQSV